jgi:hypothetical protein
MVITSGQCVRRRVRMAPVAVVAALVLLAPAAAHAQSHAAIGFTGGGSVDPEQGYAGVFWQSPAIGGRLRIRPGIDGGFGNGLRLATINVDVNVGFPLGQSGWELIQGGGPTVAITRYADVPDLKDTSAGFSYVFGFAHERGFLTEFRLGSGSVPQLKFGVGFQVRLE